jgi:hypothetical protein
MLRARQVVVGGIFILLAAVSAITIFAVYGPQQVRITHFSDFDGQTTLEIPIGTALDLLWVVDGPKWGLVTVQSVDVLDYAGMSIRSVELLRTNRIGGIFVPSDPDRALSQAEVSRLVKVEGARLRLNTIAPAVEQDCLVVGVTITSPKPSGPFRCRISYRWFGVPFTVESAVR